MGSKPAPGLGFDSGMFPFGCWLRCDILYVSCRARFYFYFFFDPPSSKIGSVEVHLQPRDDHWFSWFWRHFWSIRDGLQTSPRLHIWLWYVSLRFLTPSRYSVWLLSNNFLFLCFFDPPSSKMRKFSLQKWAIFVHARPKMSQNKDMTREDQEKIKIKMCSTKAIKNIVMESEIEGKRPRGKCEAWGWFATHIGCSRNASKTMVFE